MSTFARAKRKNESLICNFIESVSELVGGILFLDRSKCAVSDTSQCAVSKVKE